jgi:diguanylate cyclase (GGDEF)-like protein
VRRGASGADDPLTVLARKHGVISDQDSSDVDTEETPLERFAREQSEKKPAAPARSDSSKQKPAAAEPEEKKESFADRGRRRRQYVADEVKLAGEGLKEQAKDVFRPGGLKRLGAGLVHGIVDPVVTLSDAAFTPPQVRARRREARDLELAEAARRSQTGEYSEDVAEAVVKGDQRRQMIKEVMAIPQVAGMLAAPGISTAVTKKVASKVGTGLVGRVTSRAAGDAVAGAAFGATVDPEHPIAGTISMGVAGPVFGESIRLAGKGVGGAARGARNIARDVHTKISDKRVADLEAQLAAETDRRAGAERAADVDELTGIANKRAFKKALPTAEADANTAIVRFDVNGFKSVNDTHGHGAGDQALADIPSSLKKAAADLGLPDRIFRVGGDEFAAIVPKDKAAAFRDLAEELYGIKDHGSDVKTSISGGIGLNDAAADAAAMTRKQAQKAAQGIRGREDLGGATITPPEAPAPASTPLEQFAEMNGVRPAAGVFSHPTSSIEVDPSRFQFKINVNEKGVGRGLSSVETYNPKLAGTLSLWKDPANGKTYIVNGHHRLELAKRTNTDRVNVQFLEAADASEARAQGALQNIAEGQGTALDAAKFFRETQVGPEALKAEGVELTGRIAKAGLAISKLEPDVFARVASGKISENHGAAIGAVLELPEQQRAAANLIENSPKKLTDAQVTELVSQVRAAGSEKVAQDDLFGSDSEGVSLIYNRAEIASGIKAKLAADKRLFGYVAKDGRAGELARGGNQIDVETSGRIAQTSAVLEEMFDREAHAAGDVGRAITEAARRVANGEKLKAVVDEIYDPIREAVHAAIEARGAARGSAVEKGYRVGKPPAEEGSAGAGQAGAVELESGLHATLAKIHEIAETLRGNEEAPGIPLTKPRSNELLGAYNAAKMDYFNQLEAIKAIDPDRAVALHRELAQFLENGKPLETPAAPAAARQGERDMGWFESEGEGDVPPPANPYAGKERPTMEQALDWHLFEKLGGIRAEIRAMEQALEGKRGLSRFDLVQILTEHWGKKGSLESIDGEFPVFVKGGGREPRIVIGENADTAPRSRAGQTLYVSGEALLDRIRKVLELGEDPAGKPPAPYDEGGGWVRDPGRPTSGIITKWKHGPFELFDDGRLAGTDHWRLRNTETGEEVGYHGFTEAKKAAHEATGTQLEDTRSSAESWRAYSIDNGGREILGGVTALRDAQGVVTVTVEKGTKVTISKIRKQLVEEGLLTKPVKLVKDGHESTIVPHVDELKAQAVTSELEGVVDDGTVRDSTDPAQDALFRPRDTDLFGNAIDDGAPDQTSLLGDRDGTAAARNLSQTERAAHSELERLREQLPRETDPRKRVAAASRIAELEKLVNRNNAITSKELETRAIAAQQETGSSYVHLPVAELLTMADPNVPIAKLRIEDRAYLDNLKAQIARDGILKPIELITTSDGRLMIDDGMHRLAAAEELGLDEIPIVIKNSDSIDQGALFSPAARSSPLQRRIAKVLGNDPTPTTEVKAKIDITRNLEKAVGATVRQGRALLGQRQAMGVFFTKSESIRVRRFDHVDTVAHEIGHLISKKYLGNPTRQSKSVSAAYASSRVQLPSTAVKELQQMGHNLYGSRKPAGGYGEEGIAEYFSFYVTEPHRLAAEAPTFDAFMRSEIFPKEPWLLEALDQAKSDFAANQSTTAHGRIDAMLSVNERVRNMPTARGIVAGVIDDLNEFKLAVEELGGERDPARNAYTLARLSRGDAGAAEEMIQRGIFDYVTRQRTTRGIEQILGEVPRDRIQALRRYLAAERTLEVAGRGVNTGIEVKDALEVKAELEGEFGAIASELWDISNKLIDYRRDAGLLTDADAELIKKKNQKRVGFYRVFDENESQGGGMGRSFGRNSSGIQKMKGSARRIVDPLESLITDVYRTIHQSHTHAVLHQLVKLAKRTDGGAKVAEILTEKPKHAVTMPIAKIIDQLMDLGFEIPKDMPDAELMRLSAGILEHFEENRVPGPREGKDMVIPYIENGTRYWVALKDRRLYNAIAGLDRQQLPNWARILTAPTRTLRAGATLTLEFIGRNPVRDAWSAAIYSKAGFKVPGYDFARGMFSMLKRDDMYQRWRLEGGDNAAMLGLDRTAIQRSLEHFIRSGPERMRDVVIKPIDTLRLVSSAFENATRVGEFRAVYEKAIAEGMMPESAAKEGAFAARDITIDFGKSGIQGRLINEIVAFFNATVQSQVKLATELRDRPLTILPRLAASITLPSIGLYLLQRDDPVYREIPRWQKDLFWIWVQRDDAGEVSHIWRVPKPFELGVLFGSVPERILEYMETQDPGALDNMLKTVVSTATPNVLPTGVGPLVENWANKSWFRDRPIVPRGLEKLPAENQATKYSSETARALGEMFGYSPAKLDNLIRGWGGGLATDYALPIVDAGIRGARDLAGKEPLAPHSGREGNLAERLPGLRGFTIREPAGNSESIEQMYRKFDAAESKRQRWKDLLEQGKGAEAKAYLDEHRAEIMSVATKDDAGAAGALRVAHTTVGKLRDKAREIESSPTMQPTERKWRAREVYDAMVRTSRAADPAKREKDPLEEELKAIGMGMPEDPETVEALQRVINSPEYLEIDTIAARLVATDPKWAGRDKKSLAAELKRSQIEGAVPALRR